MLTLTRVEKLIEKHKIIDVLVLILLLCFSLFILYFVRYIATRKLLTSELALNVKLSKNLASANTAYLALKNQDQYKINQSLKTEIDHIHKSYGDSMTDYQNVIDLKSQKVDTSGMETIYASIVKNLSNQNYASSDSELTDLSSQIKQANDKLAQAAGPVPASSPVSSAPPSSGLSQQRVQTDTGTFSLDIIAADLNSTKVVVDTASDGDCGNNCPVFPLGTYVSRSGAYAGINGTFFCPPEYPSCAGKTNSFDTLLMNKNHVYFNSANNVYSTVPAVIFSGGSARWVTRSLEWGRDTGVDSVIAMQPLLVSNSQIVYSPGSNGKFDSPGYRSFIATKGNMVYIGFIFGATMTDSARVLKTMGMENAMNLDEGGSSALMSGGSYLVGPGRNIPNAVLFVRK